MRSLDNLVPPPAVALCIAAGMWCLARWWPIQRFELPWPQLTGLAVAALGGLVSSAGAREFRRARTTVNPLHPERASAIVTTGIYRFTRNPMYVGIVLVLVGWFLAHGGLSAAIGIPLFIGYITRFQILPEERVLAAKFGDAYSAYVARVRRWW
jgi:protein-S-isoprenylcysteine O-methyltransferase Ste14